MRQPTDGEIASSLYRDCERLEARRAELAAALTALLRHWRMGLPVHDMEDLFDAAEKALEKKS